MSFCVFTTGRDTAPLRASCERMGVTFREYPASWTDYVDVKLRKGIDFLGTITEDVVMWLDGHDTLLLKPRNEILARFIVPDTPVIMAAEANCWPDPDVAVAYPHNGISPRFLNAGGFIGYRPDVLTAMHTVLQNADGGDDQRAWTKSFLAGLLPQVSIDYCRRIFSCVADGHEALKADTCAMHWNGRLPGRDEYWLKMLEV